MKILISTSYFLPNISGITIYIKNLSEELVKRGYKVSIVTSKHSKNSKKNEIVNGVLIKRLWAPIKTGKGIIMPLFPFSIIREIIDSDEIHCHLPSIESFFLIFGKILFGKKIIITYHCDFDSGNLVINKIINLIQSFPLKIADHIVVNSKDYIENYDLLKQHRNKLIEVYPPVVNENLEEDLEINSKINKFKNKKIIGFLGRISKEKNLELLFKAVSFLKNDEYQLIIAGPNNVIGEDIYKYKINKYLKKNKKNITIIGEIKNVNTFLKKCDCLVITSNNRLESFGLVQIESINNKIPLVVSNLPGIREVVKQTKMGEIFESNNAKDLSDKIRIVLKNGKDFYNKKSQNLEKFNYKNLIDKYEKIFNLR